MAYSLERKFDLRNMKLILHNLLKNTTSTNVYDLKHSFHSFQLRFAYCQYLHFTFMIVHKYDDLTVISLVKIYN